MDDMAVILSSGAGAVIRYSEPSAARRLVGVDVVLVVSTLLVAALGLIMVYTATSSSYGHTYLERQGLFLLLGIITMTVLAFVDYRRVELVGTVIYVLVLLSLLGVLVIGHSANGAARWINIGPLEVQPSEFAVLGL